MIVDFDDFHHTQHRLDLLHELRDINPAFKVTVFAVPGIYPDESFWDDLPEWIECALHGWTHGGPDCNDAHEAANWDYERANLVMDCAPKRFVRGFKAPGWQISDATYQALLDRGWWVADQHLEDGRRPKGLRTYFYEDGVDRWHGHVQNVCGNGLQETWDQVCAKVAAATEFRFCSEALVEWT